MTRAIIFDFFDVFRTDSYKAWLQANSLKHEGPYAEASHLQDSGQITNQQFLERLSQLSGRPVTRAELDKTATVDQDVVALAETLHQTYRTALLSNAPSAFIRKLLAEHNLARLFDEIIVSSEVGLTKPSPEIFQLALDKLGVKAQEAIFVDDNAGHVAAADALGIKSIHFASAAQLRQELASAGLHDAN